SARSIKIRRSGSANTGSFFGGWTYSFDVDATLTAITGKRQANRHAVAAAQPPRRRAEHAVLNPNKSEGRQAGTRTGDTRRDTQVGTAADSCETPRHPHEGKLTWRTSRTASVVPRKLSSDNVDLAFDGPCTTTTSRIQRVSSSA
ncbi:unnamed protein product, partial [Ixodes pacificus]